MINVFQVLGIIGLIFVIFGILTKNRRRQDISYIIGGICLLAYSFYLRDYIFMALQIIFVIAAILDPFRKKSLINL